MGHVGGQHGIVSYEEDRLRNSRRSLHCKIPVWRMLPTAAIVVVAVLLSPSGALAQDGVEAEFSFMFESGAEGWMVEFADSRPRQGSTRSPVR